MAKRLPKSEQDSRNLEIVLESRAGASQTRIAQRWGMNERSIRRILKNFPARMPQAFNEPLLEIEDNVLALRSAIEELAAIAEETSYERVRVQAIGKKVNALGAEFKLYERLGLVPDLSPTRPQHAREFSADFFQWCRRKKVAGEPLSDDAIKVIRLLLEDFVSDIAKAEGQ